MIMPVPKRVDLPPELLELNQFVCWREVERKGAEKPTKIPIAPWATGHLGAVSAKEPRNWTSFENAAAYALKNELGVGIALRYENCLTGIDLDDCIEKGQLSEFAQRIIREANSYTEFSPSGRGIRIFVRGRLRSAIKKPHIEAYDRDRFFTLTGKRLGESPLSLNDNQDFLDRLCDEFGEKPERTWLEKEYEIPILELFERLGGSGLRRRGKQLQGPHPVHGSTTGWNFSINQEKNCFYCYRHMKGGGPISLAGIMKRIFTCEQFAEGNVSPDAMRRARMAVAELGYIPPEHAGYFEDGRFVPKFLAEELMREHRFVTHRESEVIYVYQDGVYHRFGKQIIKARAQEKLGKETTTERVNQVVEYIRRETFAPPERFNPPQTMINVRNGIIELNPDIRVREHSPDLIFLNQLPVEYDPKADCPAIRKFLNEVFHPEDVDIFVEWAGYCLLRDYRFQKALLLVGDGANGKSTALNLLKRFLGHGNVSACTLQDLIRDRFAPASLFGKLANICADLPTVAIQQTGTFKMLTGGDVVEAQEKFYPRFTFHNYAKLVFSANRLPPVEDESSAFFRRWLILNCPNRFEGDRADPKILDKLTTAKELSGLLNLALEGLRRLLERGGFSRSETEEEIREEYMRKSDPVGAFVMDRLVPDPGSLETKDVVYRDFVNYCGTHRLPAVDKAVFARKLPQHIETRAQQRTVGGRRQRCWVGIKLLAPSLTLESFSEEGGGQGEGAIKGNSGQLPSPAQDAQAFSYFFPKPDFLRGFAKGGYEKGLEKWVLGKTGIEDPVHPVHLVQSPRKGAIKGNSSLPPDGDPVQVLLKALDPFESGEAVPKAKLAGPLGITREELDRLLRDPRLGSRLIDRGAYVTVR